MSEESAATPVESATEPEPKARKFPVAIVALAALVVVGAFFGVRFYIYNSSHITTDDAYITTDIIPINPQVSSNIVAIPVKENQDVKAGQLLAQLDDTTFVADVDQAKANLAVAQANLQSSAADLGLTTETGQAQVSEAQGGVQAGGSDIAAAQSNVNKAISGVSTAEATYNSSLAQAKAADATVQSQIATRTRLQKQVAGALAAVNSAQAAVKTAEANLRNAQASWNFADKDARRYLLLAQQGAVASSQAESKAMSEATTRAAVDAAQQQVQAAHDAVAQQQAAYAAAQEQIHEADAAIATARAQARAAHRNAEASRTRIAQADSDVASARQAVQSAIAHQTQNVGKLGEAQALPKRISMSEAAHQQALAKVKQAQAALESAQVALNRTRITAPVTGRITRKTAEIGQQVTPGQPLMSLIPVEAPWIVANFKETQMRDLRVGQEVEFEVDAFPGHTFKGHVNSVSPGTGATFALLPADNATGNFTKVVQRVPVKITVDPNQADLDKLAAGLSTNVSVVVK